MKYSTIASIFALAGVGMAVPSPNEVAKGSAAFEHITSLAARAPVPNTLNKRGPCPEAGSGNIDPCCYDSGPDKNCRSKSNCYTRCGPTGPNDIGGPIGCVLGCNSVCPSDPEC